ncbi:MAG: hypothetical protein KDI13_10165 [Alphaproteobacteria bacterium]|nr:hypothetical protein [Alphaproteobacteria bacterium]
MAFSNVLQDNFSIEALRGFWMACRNSLSAHVGTVSLHDAWQDTCSAVEYKKTHYVRGSLAFNLTQASQRFSERLLGDDFHRDILEISLN